MLGLGINECRDDITRRRERQVDLRSLLEPLPGSTSLGLRLTPQGNMLSFPTRMCASPSASSVLVSTVIVKMECREDVAFMFVDPTLRFFFPAHDLVDFVGAMTT